MHQATNGECLGSITLSEELVQRDENFSKILRKRKIGYPGHIHGEEQHYFQRLTSQVKIEVGKRETIRTKLSW